MVCPDMMLLPLAAGNDRVHWTVFRESRRVLVRMDEQQGFVCEPENLDLLIKRWAENDTPNNREQPPLPDLLPEQVSTSESLPVVLSESSVARPVFDFRQGPYRVRADLARWWLPWKTAAVLAVLAIAVQLGAVYGDVRQLRHEQQALDNAMRAIFRQAVPQATTDHRPALRLQQLLHQLQRRHGVQPAVFFELLTIAGARIDDVRELSLKALRFANGRLEFDLEKGSPAVLDRLQRQLNAMGRIRVSMKTVQQEGRLETRITVQER